MPNPVWTMEEANLYCGADVTDSAASNHLILTEVKLPGLDEQFVDHRPGGAPVAIEIDTIIARLECTFSLLGMTPQVMGLIGSWGTQQNWFTIYGAIRDQITGEIAQAVALLKGRLGRSDPQNFRKGDSLHTAYAIRGIIHYELNIAGSPIYLWDFATNTRIIGGVDQNRSINAVLGINSVAAPAFIQTVAGFVPGE